MGLWDRVRAALGRERRDLADAVDDLTARADAALDERERLLRATPEERLAHEQERSEEIDAEFDAVRRRIEDGGRGDSTG